VSVTTDRGSNGYRPLVDVLGDNALYSQLLDDARADMKRFVDRYNIIHELRAVVREMAKALAVIPTER